MADRVVVILGSGGDEEFAKPIWTTLEKHKVAYSRRVLSAHKRTLELLDMLKKDEESKDNVVYITVAGRSNALSGVVDSNTRYIVIACPPYSETFSGADIYSSLRVPSGIGSVVTIEPEGAAIAAAKILALEDSATAENVKNYQASKKKELEKANESVKKLK